MRIAVWTLGLTIGACGLSLGVAARQQGNADTVPKDLVALLLRGGPVGPNDQFELRVGPAPADFPKDILPEGTTVVVSAVSDRGIIVAGTAAAFRGASRLAYEGQLTAAGWLSTGPGFGGGFVSGPNDRPISVCRGSEFGGVSLIPRAEGGIYVRAAVSRDTRRPCVSRPASFFGDISIPNLVAPPDSKMVGGTGGGGNADTWYATGRLETKLDAAAVSAYYVSQLTDAAWTVAGRASDGVNAIITRLTTQSRAGETVTGVLTVVAVAGATQQDLTFRIVRPVIRQPQSRASRDAVDASLMRLSGV